MLLEEVIQLRKENQKLTERHTKAHMAMSRMQQELQESRKCVHVYEVERNDAQRDAVEAKAVAERRGKQLQVFQAAARWVCMYVYIYMYVCMYSISQGYG